MAGSATAPLAVAVTKAGGLGQIGSANDLKALVREPLEDDGRVESAAVGEHDFVSGLGLDAHGRA